MILQVDENKMCWPYTLGSQWRLKNIIYRSQIPLWGIRIKMILSRAKPAIGGDKAEEKGGSAGRKQVVPHIILFFSQPYIILTSSSFSTLWCCIHLRVFLVGHVSDTDGKVPPPDLMSRDNYLLTSHLAPLLYCPSTSNPFHFM